MVTLITIIHVFVCFFLILVVLLQAGKGGGMGIAFGSSTSSQVFGGRGAGSFLEKLTAGTAIVFMLTSITLAYFASQTDSARLQRKAAQQKAAEQKAGQTATQKAADDKAQKDAAERAKQISTTPPAPAATPSEPKAVPASDAKPAPKASVPAAQTPAPKSPATEKPAAPAPTP